MLFDYSWDSYRQNEPLIRALMNAFRPNGGFYNTQVSKHPQLLAALGGTNADPGSMLNHVTNFGRYAQHDRAVYGIEVVRRSDRGDGNGSFFRFA